MLWLLQGLAENRTPEWTWAGLLLSPLRTPVWGSSLWMLFLGVYTFKPFRGHFLWSQQPLLCALDYNSLPCQRRDDMLISTEQQRKMEASTAPKHTSEKLISTARWSTFCPFSSFFFFFFFRHCDFLSLMEKEFSHFLSLSFSAVIVFLLWRKKMTAGAQCCSSFCGWILLFKMPRNPSPLIASQGGDQTTSQQENLKHYPMKISGRRYFFYSHLLLQAHKAI